VANHFISIARSSSARQCWSVLACIASQYRTHVIIQWIEIWRLKYQQKVIFKSESQFNYLFTLKNVHLSSTFERKQMLQRNLHNVWPELFSVSSINLAKKFTTIPEISNFSWAGGVFFGAPIFPRVIVLYHADSTVDLTFNLLYSEVLERDNLA